MRQRQPGIFRRMVTIRHIIGHKRVNRLIVDAVNPVSSAEVFKKSSEINLKKGAYEAALEDYQLYIAENEKVLKQKQAELDHQVDILKEQGKIDLLVKDIDIEEKEQIYEAISDGANPKYH